MRVEYASCFNWRSKSSPISRRVSTYVASVASAATATRPEQQPHEKRAPDRRHARARSRSPRRGSCESRRRRACGADCGRALRRHCFPPRRPSRRDAPRAAPSKAPSPAAPASAASSANSRLDSSTGAPSRVTVRVDGIEHDAAVAQHVVAARDVATQERAHPRRELVLAERLDEVVVGAGVEPRHTIGDRRPCAVTISTRTLLPAATHFAEQLEPALLRQAEVEQHQRVGVVRSCRARASAGLSVLHPVDGHSHPAARPHAASCRSWGRLRREGCASRRGRTAVRRHVRSPAAGARLELTAIPRLYR